MNKKILLFFGFPLSKHQIISRFIFLKVLSNRITITGSLLDILDSISKPIVQFSIVLSIKIKIPLSASIHLLFLLKLIFESSKITDELSDCKILSDPFEASICRFESH